MSSPINPGALVHKVTIQVLTPGTDAAGAPTVTPSTLCEAWMACEPERSGERFAAGQLSAAGLLRWAMRYSADMDPRLVDVPATRRLLYEGRSYDIVTADLLGRKDQIVLRTLASSQVAA